MKLFVSGSRSITSLSDEVIETLSSLIVEMKKPQILIGDAPGVDSLIQKYLHSIGYPDNKVLVYHIGVLPRNHHGNFYTKRVHTSSQTGKDVAMTRDCDSGLAVIYNNSKGTRANIERLARLKKECKISHISNDEY